MTINLLPAMEVLLFFMASITGGIWCSYFVEYLEDKKLTKNLSETEHPHYTNSRIGSQKQASKSTI